MEEDFCCELGVLNGVYMLGVYWYVDSDDGVLADGVGVMGVENNGDDGICCDGCDDGVLGITFDLLMVGVSDTSDGDGCGCECDCDDGVAIGDRGCLVLCFGCESCDDCDGVFLLMEGGDLMLGVGVLVFTDGVSVVTEMVGLLSSGSGEYGGLLCMKSSITL